MKKILVFLLTVASLVTLASPIKSDGAAKGIAYIEDGSSVPSAAEYVQSGLIHMWDGIENVGWGVHDDNATVWTDLMGTRDMSVNSKYSFSKNAFVRDSSLVSETACSFQGRTTLYWDMCCAVTDIGDGTSTLNAFIKLGRYGVSFLHFPYDGTIYCGNDSPVPGYYMPLSADLPKGVTFFFSPNNKGFIYCNGEQLQDSGLSCGYTGLNDTQRFFSQRINGKIFCIRAYNRRLTDEEIAYNHLIDKARFGL